MRIRSPFLLYPAFLAILWMAGCESTAPEEEPITGIEVFPPYPWPVSTPARSGLDSLRIDSALGQVRSQPFIYALLIVHGDSLVTEYYRPPFTAFNDFDLRSATKSIVSVLVGIGRDDGLIPDLDTPFLTIFPEYASASQDPRKDSITLRHLLTMRGGFDYEDGGRNSDVVGASSDWLRAFFDLPLMFSPGERFAYSSLQTHMLSAVISRVTGGTTAAYLQSRLFDPLSISIRSWDTDPVGYHNGGTGLFLTPRDMARFGHMILRNGRAGGMQVVSTAWLDSSFVARNSTDFSGTELSRVNYGYQWWLSLEQNKELRIAWGYAGQFIIIDPARDLVIVASANPPDDGASAVVQEAVILNIIVRYILPAVS